MYNFASELKMFTAWCKVQFGSHLTSPFMTYGYYIHCKNRDICSFSQGCKKRLMLGFFFLIASSQHIILAELFLIWCPTTIVWLVRSLKWVWFQEFCIWLSYEVLMSKQKYTLFLPPRENEQISLFLQNDITFKLNSYTTPLCKLH